MIFEEDARFSGVSSIFDYGSLDWTFESGQADQPEKNESFWGLMTTIIISTF